MEQVGYQIVHSIAGRIRIRVSWLDSDPQAASSYQRLVEGLSGVKTVRVNGRAKSLIVEYSIRALSIPKIEELLISTMQQVKPTPPAATPTVEPVPEPTEAKVPESPSESSVSTTQHNAEPASSPRSEVKQVVLPEIPSPWDEEVKEQSSAFTSEQTTTIEDATPILKCSTASLAKRLRVTSQAITRRRTKSDFGQWTQAQDPEGIAWNYDEHDRSFRPASSTPSKID